jgi:hypothetical protein
MQLSTEGDLCSSASIRSFLARSIPMKTHSKLIAATTAFLLLLPLVSLSFPAAAQKAGLPVLVTSCGQSGGPTKFEIFLKKLKMDYVYNMQATAADLIAKSKSGTPFKSIVIVTGSSLKGMGAAGVSINDEIARTKALIAEAKKQNIKVIGAHIGGVQNRAQGAAPGDNTDEMSIDAVCPFSSLLIVKKDGDEDGRFTTISKDKNVPMISFEKNLDLETVIKDLFSK